MAPSQPLFPYVNDNQLRTKKTFRQFISFGLKNSSGLVSKSNYIPLPDATYRLVESKKYRHILGTSFGGDLPVGLTIGQAIDRSFASTQNRISPLRQVSPEETTMPTSFRANLINPVRVRRLIHLGLPLFEQAIQIRQGAKR